MDFNKFIRAYKFKILKLKINLSAYSTFKNILIMTLIIFSIGAFYLGFTLEKLQNNLPSTYTLVHFINVGQGDAILIENSDFNILIDSGPNISSQKLISYLKKQNINKLNYVIATHPHEDHIGAMDDIVNTFPIDTIIAPKIQSKDTDFINLTKALQEENLKFTIINDNTNIDLSKGNNLTFLWSNNQPADNINNNSIVLKYTMRNISFLFTGDMESEVETTLNINSEELLNSSVLKVPHHGSNSSSTLNFLNAVNPRISVITCGMGNDYGHPHKNTLINLNNINSLIYRTDLNGTVVLKTDGNKIWVNTEYDK